MKTLFTFTGYSSLPEDSCTTLIDIESDQKSGQEEASTLLNHMRNIANEGCKYHKVAFYYCKFIWKWKECSSETKQIQIDRDTSTISNEGNKSTQERIDSTKDDQKLNSKPYGNTTNSQSPDKGKGQVTRNFSGNNVKDFEKSATDLSDNTTLFTNDVHVVEKGNSNENKLTK